MEDIFDLLKGRNFLKSHGLKLSALQNVTDYDEVRKHVFKIIADHKKFIMLFIKYQEGERIDRYSNKTAWLFNPDIIIAIDKKYFPEINSFTEGLRSEIATFMCDDHVYTIFRIENDFTKEFKTFAWRFCPMEICFDRVTRSQFFNLMKVVIQKRKQGVTDQDREGLITHIFDRRTFEDIKGLNYLQLKSKVEEEQYKVYGVLNDGMATLPFYSLYSLIDATFGYNAETCKYDREIFSKRLREGLTMKEGWLYDRFLMKDLDYCDRCLLYSDYLRQTNRA